MYNEPVKPNFNKQSIKSLNVNTTYAFIDSQNLNLGTMTDIRSGKRTIYKGWKLDFKKFRIYLKEKYKVAKAFLFIGFMPENEKLYEALKAYGYELIFKPVIEDGEHKVKGNVDAELVLYTMIEYPNYDKAIIVSGDGDFYCLIDYLNKQDKIFKLLVPNSVRYSSLLKPFAVNKIDFMNNLRKKLGYKKREAIA